MLITYIFHLVLYFRSATTLRTSVLFQNVFVYWQIFIQVTSVKFHTDPCIGSRCRICVRVDGPINMARITGAFRDLREKRLRMNENIDEIHPYRKWLRNS